MLARTCANPLAGGPIRTSRPIRPSAFAVAGIRHLLRRARPRCHGICRPETGDEMYVNHAEDLLRLGNDPRWRRNRAALSRRRTSSGCAAPSASNTRWRAWARSGCGICCTREPYVAALGALTGNQAVQQVQAGLKAIYLSGWQVAGDANLARPDVSRPEPLSGQQRARVVRAINNALLRADQIHRAEGEDGALLVRPHRGRCRGRFRRPAERLRADEGA